MPSPDSYEKVRGFITPTQEGVMYWTAMLKQKYGGNWDVDFDIIAPGSKFSQKPDIIINLVTRNEKTRCNDVAGWAFVSIFKPVNTVVCAQSYGFFNSKVEVSGTAAHEFIHAMGLGHAYNKIGDLMCSNTCPSGYGKSNQPSDFNLVAVAELYRTDGFRNPNNSVYYDDELTAEEYLQGSSSTTTSIIYSTTPPKPPATTGILLGDYKEFVSNWFGFTIEYPSNWIVDDKVLRDESGFSIVGFTPDGDYTNSIYVLNRQNEPEMVGLTDNSYLRLLKENTKNWCTTADFEFTGFTCDSISVVNTKKLSIDGWDAYQIEYTYLKNYPDESIQTITRQVEIPIGEKYWQIITESEQENWTNFKPAFVNAINSFNVHNIPVPINTEPIKPTSTVTDTDNSPDSKPTPKPIIPDFVDPQKGAQHYLDRYNNEPIYKAWFDKSYPDYTLEQAIELSIPDAFSKKPEPEPPEPEKVAEPEKEKFCFLWWCW